MKNLIKALSNSIIETRCVLCSDFVSRNVSLCEACEMDLPLNDFACVRCAIPMPAPESEQYTRICGECISQPSDIDYAYSLFHYEAPMVELITQMKFGKKITHASILDYLFSKHFAQLLAGKSKPDAILPIPLHPRRLAKRGFNQSLEISRSLSKAIDVPILLDLARRIKNTQSQTDLSKKSRRQNVKGCFKLLQKPIYSHIVIVDDVVTTGATTKEMASLLKKAGVKKVGVLSVARAEITYSK